MSNRQRRGISFLLSGVMLCSLMANPVYAGEYEDSVAVGAVVETAHTHEAEDIAGHEHAAEAAAGSEELAAQDVEQGDGAILAADEENGADVLLPEDSEDAPEEELQVVAAGEEELTVTGIEVLSDGLPEGSDAPADGDAVDGDETVPDADVPQEDESFSPGDTAAEDTTAPVITLTPAVAGHTDGKSEYCENPNIVITDETGVKEVTVEWFDYVKSSPPAKVGEKKVNAGNEKTFKLDLTETADIFTIVASDGAGNESEPVKFTIGHTLKGRTIYRSAATCEQPGFYAQFWICGRCQKEHSPSYSVLQNQLSHEWEEKQGCGGTYKVCKLCGTVDDVSAESLNHQWGEVKTQEADCVNRGYEYQECTECGAKKITSAEDEITPAMGHEYVFDGFWSDANCGEYSYRTGRCKKCGFQTRQKSTFTVSHNYVLKYEGEGTLPCNEVATASYVCTKCGEEDPERSNIQVQGIEHKKAVRTQKPDCKTPGYEVDYCTVCGEEISERREIPALGHKYGEYETETSPNCTEPGTEVRRCVRCGEKDEENIKEIPPLGHKVEPDDGDCLTQRKCEMCGIVMVEAETEHNFEGAEYTGDNDKHWHVCTNEGCTATDAAVEHTRAKGPIIDCQMPWNCTVCGYRVKPTIEHDYELEPHPSYFGFHIMGCQNPGCVVTDDKTMERCTPEEDDGDCTTPVHCTVCGGIVVRAKSHNPGGEWKWNAEGHYQECEHEGCDQIVLYPHTYPSDDSDCTTPVKCTEPFCEYEQSPGLTHSFVGEYQYDENSHWKVCANEGCSARQSEEHHGGVATCKVQAVCADCGQPYGSTDPETHVHTKLQGQKEATNTENGYTGDLICEDCNEIIQPGSVIPANHTQHIEDGEWKTDGLHHWKVCSFDGCGELIGYEMHDYEGQPYKTDENGCHYQVCKVCGLETLHEEHIRPEDDGNCTTDILCETCKAVIVPGNTAHNFTGAYVSDGDSHWQLCVNENCAQTSEKTAHTGGEGTADCVSGKKCEVCGSAYGEKDPSRHVGGEIVYGYKPATETEPGYTGDIYCKGCATLIAEGQEIMAGEREHDYRLEWDETHHWYACYNCGQRREDSYVPHTYGEDGICTEPGCDNQNMNPGHTVHTGGEATCVSGPFCEVCGLEYGEADPNAHKMGSWTTEKAQTCTEDGMESRVCVRCGGQKETRTLQASGQHEWETDYTTDVEATCTSEGRESIHCRNCGASQEGTEKVIPAPGHQPMEDDGDCTTPVLCEVCGGVTVGAGSEHNFRWMNDENDHWQQCVNENCEVTEQKEAHQYVESSDCTKAGICEVCGYAKPGNAEHTWGDKYLSLGNGTHVQVCMNEGCTATRDDAITECVPENDDHDCTTDLFCADCGALLEKGEAEHLCEDVEIYCDDLDYHYWRCQREGCSGIKKEPHTGVDDGDCTTVVKCTNPYCTALVKPAALHHDFSGDYLSDADGHWKACRNEHCTQVSDKEAHSWNGGVITKAATCTQAGVRTYSCTTCSVTRTEVIPAAGHKWSEWTFSADQTAQTRSCSSCHATESREVELTANSLKMKTGQSTTKFKVTDMAPGDRIVSVKSSNKKLLKVSKINKKKGTFKLKAGKKKGTVKLTVTLASGLKKTIRIKVQGSKVKTTKVKVTGSLTLKKGKNTTLKPVVTPVTSQDKVSYKSSNPAVASVSAKGVVKAKKKGTAKITVKAGSKKAVCTVTVR